LSLEVFEPGRGMGRGREGNKDKGRVKKKLLDGGFFFMPASFDFSTNQPSGLLYFFMEDPFMNTHLIGFLIGAITFCSGLFGTNIIHIEQSGEPVRQIKPAQTVLVEKSNHSVRRQINPNEVQRDLLLNLAVQSCRTFWTNINKEEFTGIGFIEITLIPETPMDTARWQVRMQLIPKNSAEFQGAPVFTSESYPGNVRLAWNIEEDPERDTPETQNDKLFVFKKTGQRFIEIRPNVFRAE
jgi:hypothetical protein